MSKSLTAVETRRCQDLSTARSLEWLVVNGRGGFASASITQMLTRRYHGLLVAAINPPVQRFVLLAKLDVTAMIDGLTYELATNDFHEAVHPHGHRLLDSFSLRPCPTWRWRAGDALIEQTLCMGDGEDTTYVQYHVLRGSRPVTLMVRPLCTSRHFHHLNHQPDSGTPEIDEVADGFQLRWPGERPAMWLSHNGEFRNRPDWYYRYLLAAERDRGYDHSQDLFMPGPICQTINPGERKSLVVAASAAPCDWQKASSAFRAAAEADALQADWDEWATASGNTPCATASSSASRGAGNASCATASSSASRTTASSSVSADDPLLTSLVRAARDFIVRRGETGKTIIAGYPWFEDWGRDTFISLPGLCLVTGRFDDARRIIAAFAEHVDGGMIPNRFPPYGEPPAYNTVDATLWYIHAMDRYLAYTGDQGFIVGQTFPVVAGIIESHIAGTRHNIRVDADGLLAAGEPGHALTWMDALVDGRAITPRIGKPVEVNALWYNALMIAATFADLAGDETRANAWRAAAERAKHSFNEKFWNAEAGCLFDVIDVNFDSGATDGSIRPNQLLALSLTHPVLDTAQPRRWRGTVETCERELWTPMGLRTLSPADSAYRPRYDGDLASRDAAYHQGTVWPWLLGPFITAFVRAHGGEHAAARLAVATRDGNAGAIRGGARRFLDGLIQHIGQAGLGSVSEVADGDAPHTPGGCPWQAWSVAEPLRALCEDVLGTHPNVPREAKITPQRHVSPVRNA